MKKRVDPSKLYLRDLEGLESLAVKLVMRAEKDDRCSSKDLYNLKRNIQSFFESLESVDYTKQSINTAIRQYNDFKRNFDFLPEYYKKFKVYFAETYKG